jgi:hypothetical protein
MIIAAVVLSDATLGSALLGEMDVIWNQHVLDANLYSIPGKWRWTDCFAIGVACLINLGGAFYPGQARSVRRFLIVICTVALAGMIGGVLAEVLPYRLLLQGQPYRAVWLAQFLQYPIGFWLAFQLATTRIRECQFAAIAIVSSILFRDVLLWLSTMAMIGGSWSFVKLLRCPAADRWPHGVAISIVLVIATRQFVATEYELVNGFADLRVLVAPITLYRLVSFPVAPFIGFSLALWLIHVLVLHAHRFIIWGGALAFGLFFQSGAFLFPYSSIYNRIRMDTGDDIQFESQFLEAERDGRDEVYTVQWPRLYDGPLWFDFNCTTYFSWQQLAGNMFNRETAIEGSRRARLVQRFDASALQQYEGVAPWQRRSMSKIYGCSMNAASPPVVRDLLVLCQEEELDYLITRHSIGEHAVATNGRWYIYDCGDIRRTISQQASPDSHVRQTFHQNQGGGA